MTQKKKPEELTDAALIRRLFPKEVVQEAKKEAKKAEKRATNKGAKPTKSATSG